MLNRENDIFNMENVFYVSVNKVSNHIKEL